jgi:hypothetical protein
MQLPAMTIGRGLGIAALAIAIVGIFVPFAGIFFSIGAIVLAVAAALNGEYGLAAGTSGVVGLNSLVLSPALWIMIPAGQLIVFAFVLCLVAAPFGAMALNERLPRLRYGIVLSVGWVLVAPAIVNDRMENYGNGLFSVANSACIRRHSTLNPEISKRCYDEGAVAKNGAPAASPALLAGVSFAPVAFVWLGYLLFVRQRPPPGIPEPRG